MMKTLCEKIKESIGFVSFSPVSPDQIASAEEVLGLSFAPEYKDYLSAFGAAFFHGHEMTGIGPSKRLNVVDVTVAARKDISVPRDMYVVEETHVDNILIWQNASGSVFISKPGIVPQKVADSLMDYLKL